MFIQQRPVEPGGFIILGVGVVIPLLRPPHLVTHEQHRRAKSEQVGNHEVLNLAAAHRFDAWVGAGSFHTIVPAQVVIAAVAIILTVRLVVLAVVCDQVVQGKAVVAGDKVDAPLRLTLLAAEDIRAAAHALGKMDGAVCGRRA